MKMSIIGSEASDYREIEEALEEREWREADEDEDHEGDELDGIRMLDETEGTRISANWHYEGGLYYAGSDIVATDELPAGYYSIGITMHGKVYFAPEEVEVDNMLKLPDTKAGKVLKDAEDFWDREEIYREYDSPFKRGVLLHGPPGSGKTSTIRLLMQDLIQRKGIIVESVNVRLLRAGMEELRKKQPHTPVIAIMEDFETIVAHSENERDILQLLDGIVRIDKILYIATTNHPEKLGARFTNRPKRFDTVMEIGFPEEEARRMYLEYVIGGKGKFDVEDQIKKLDIDIDKWAKDSENFSFAHLDELFTSVIIIGKDYDEALEYLRSLQAKPEGYNFDGSNVFPDPPPLPSGRSVGRATRGR